jgi:hypothetical protein
MNSIQSEEVLKSLTKELGLMEQADKRAQLQLYINDLLLNDFNALIFLLYRADVNEAKLRSILAEHKDCDASVIITDLLIERLNEKAITREKFKNNNEIAEEEKW